jgi:hypothetical protein
MRKVLFLVCCAIIGAGCSGGGSGKTKYTISGKVELDGKALEEGDITFIPKTEGLHPGGGKINGGSYSVELEDGNYSVKIVAMKRVPLAKGEPSVSGEKDKLVSIIPDRYNEKTELTAQVSGATRKDFQLKSK